MISLGIPRTRQVQPMTPAASTAGITSRPERTVRPVDLAAVRTQRPGDELPSWSDNAGLPLVISRGGIAIFVGEREKRAVTADRSVLVGSPWAHHAPVKAPG